jgi:hypothetical protein
MAFTQATLDLSRACFHSRSTADWTCTLHLRSINGICVCGTGLFVLAPPAWRYLTMAARLCCGPAVRQESLKATLSFFWKALSQGLSGGVGRLLV